MSIPTRIIHDAAVASAQCCVELIEPLIHESEKETAFQEFFRIVHAGLEAAFLFAAREQRRLHPLSFEGDHASN